MAVPPSADRIGASTEPSVEVVGDLRISSAAVSFGGMSSVDELLARWGSGLVFTRAEREYASSGLPRLDRWAGRVAAKRCLLPLVELLAPEGPSLTPAVEVLHRAGAGPMVSCAARSPSGGEQPAITLTIAHDGGVALAVAIALVGAGAP